MTTSLEISNLFEKRVDHSLLQQIASTVSLDHRDFYDTIDTYIESEEYSCFDLEELWVSCIIL